MPTAKNIEDGFKQLGSGLRDFYSKNKTHIFTALSIGGTVVTCVSSAKAGARIARRIDAEENRRGRYLTAKEKIELSWKDMLLPAGSCIFACASSLNSDLIATDMIAKSNALAITTAKAYDALSKKTKDVLGEKKAKQIQDEITKEKMETATAPNGRLLLTKSAFDDAPKTGSGTLVPFVDGYSMLPFWSNVDYIEKCILKLQTYMANLEPRGGEYDYEDKIVGVPYREWLSYIGYGNSVANTPERKYKGWNKGFEKDGSGDDPISYSRTTMEYEPGFPVCVINWDRDPTDMKLGRLIKGSGL